MQTPLLGCGPIVENECTVVLEKTHTLIVTRETQQNIQTVQLEAEDDILMT